MEITTGDFKTISKAIGMPKIDCSNVSLEAFGMYFKAISNVNVTLEEYETHIKTPFPDTHTTIRLPKCTPGVEKRTYYRVALAHRALRYQLGTFSLVLPKPVPFNNADDELQGSADRTSIGLEEFFSCFSDSRLARFVFEAVDGARIDSCLRHLLPGLAISLEQIRKHELKTRPQLTELVPKAAAMEVLMQASLGAEGLKVPLPIRAQCETACGILNSLDLRNASSGTIAIAAIRIYSVINKLPSLGKLRGDNQHYLHLPNLTIDPVSIWPKQWPERLRVQIEGDDVLQVAVPPVVYRGTLEALVSAATSAPAPDHQAIFRLSSVDDGNLKDAQNHKGGTEIQGPPEPLPHEHHDVSRDLHTHEEGELVKTGPNTYLYRN